MHHNRTKVSNDLSQSEHQLLANEIAEQLQEVEAIPRQQILNIIELCGPEFARSLVDETIQLEGDGGLMLPDGSRRRTIGGVFFYLVRQRVERDLKSKIYAMAKSQVDLHRPRKAPLVRVPFEWENRVAIIQQLMQQQGAWETVKVTLIGRPSQVDASHKDLVITTMTHTAASATLPKGVPAPPESPTLYTVYMAAKQWTKVEEALDDAEDILIVDGICAFDPDLQAVAVYAQSLTTRNLEAQKKKEALKEKRAAARKAAPPEGGGAPRGDKLPRKDKRPATTSHFSAFDSAPLPPEPELETAPAEINGVPAAIHQKLSELYASASLFRQKIATLQSKPAGQQFGLEMTQKLLKQVEDEIAGLEKQYPAR
jgi:hypothetical protein